MSQPLLPNGKRFLFFFVFGVLSLRPALAAPVKHVEDFAAPYNLQSSLDERSVALTWAWDAPDPSPQFLTFQYEIFRDSGVVAQVPKTAYTDYNLPPGRHVYKVRAVGTSKEMGHKFLHTSGWSETTERTVVMKCGGPPAIDLQVTPNKSVYRGVPALRLHFVGDVKVPPSCELGNVMFHLDNGLSSPRTGPLKVDARGHFDDYIDAVGPDDEPPSGGATYSITASAGDEAGSTTSSQYTIELRPANPFAPHNY